MRVVYLHMYLRVLTLDVFVGFYIRPYLLLAWSTDSTAIKECCLSFMLLDCYFVWAASHIISMLLDVFGLLFVLTD